MVDIFKLAVWVIALVKKGGRLVPQQRTQISVWKETLVECHRQGSLQPFKTAVLRAKDATGFGLVLHNGDICEAKLKVSNVPRLLWPTWLQRRYGLGSCQNYVCE